LWVPEIFVQLLGRECGDFFQDLEHMIV
jgi:hypothetical protein